MSVKDNFPQIVPSLMLDFARTKALDPRITFSRASTATFYDGKTVTKAEENFTFPSNTLSGGRFVNRRVTLATNSTTAPDGTTTASLVAEDTNTNSHGVDCGVNVVSGLSYTKSVFVKKGTGATAPDIVQIPVSNGILTNTGYANFDISVGGGTSGTVTANSVNVTASIVSAGNGWYRCVVTFTATASAVLNEGLLYLTNNNPTAIAYASYAGQTSSDVFLWGAQLEQRSSVTAYTPTTTQPITNYIPVLQTAAANVARFDHNPVTGESLGLRIEEQRTNLTTYSDAFANAAYNKVNSTISANQNVAPDGALTADLLVDDTTNGGHSIQLPSTTTTVQSYTLSVYAKAYSLSKIMLYGLNADGKGVGFDLLNGTTFAVTGIVLSTSYSITPVGNGWYRCSITFTGAATTSNCGAIYTVSGTDFSYAGTGKGIYIWGAQLEAGAFPTSYIPTVASQVTRSADRASMTGANFSSWYRADASTFYYDFASGNVSTHGGNAPYDTLIGAVTNGAREGSQNSLVFISGWKARSRFTPDMSASIINTGGSATTTISSTLKIATFLDQTAMGGSGNGGAVVTTSFTVPPSYPPNMFYINERLNGCIRKVAYYPIRCTNTQLQALTQG